MLHVPGEYDAAKKEGDVCVCVWGGGGGMRGGNCEEKDAEGIGGEKDIR